MRIYLAVTFVVLDALLFGPALAGLFGHTDEWGEDQETKLVQRSVGYGTGESGKIDEGTIKVAMAPITAPIEVIKELIKKWKGRPSCDAGGTVASLSTSPQETLGDFERLTGGLTTPIKPAMPGWDWIDTGCEAVGIGRPVRSAQHSTDDLWTIDVKIEEFEINGVHAPSDRYIRLEVKPGESAHAICEKHLFTSSDRIHFGGPVYIDQHNFGHETWLEVHPVGDLYILEEKKRPTHEKKRHNGMGWTPQPVYSKSDGGSFEVDYGVQVGNKVYMVRFQNKTTPYLDVLGTLPLPE
jgi:hypothetical protein